MKHSSHNVVVFTIILLLCMSFTSVVYANSAEPPSFTVIVANPPEDLSLSVQFADHEDLKAIVLNKEQKAWETYYRFFYHMSPIKNDDLNGAVLIVQSDEKSFQCPVPDVAFSRYNNLLTLDMVTESLAIGQKPLRVPLLVVVRVVLTLAIEGFIFLLFGYRKKSSWLAFFIINIVTQGGLNAMLIGPNLESYWIIGFIFGEILVLVAELIAFICLVKEFGKRRAVDYTIVANVVSLILGGLLISYLPV